jgi:hypothetical protein
VVTTSVDTVPMTATSKVDKAALQDLLRREGQRIGVARGSRAAEAVQHEEGAGG